VGSLRRPISDPLPYRIAGHRSSITVCGGVPSKVASDCTKTNTPAEGSFNSWLIMSGTSAVPLFWAPPRHQICIHYIYGTFLPSKGGNKRNTCAQGPTDRRNIFFLAIAPKKRSIDRWIGRWIGSFPE